MDTPFLLEDGRLYLSEMVNQALLGDSHPAVVSLRSPSGYLSPSSASAVVKDPKTGMPCVVGTCLREAYYRMTCVAPSDDTKDPDLIRKRDLGEVIAKTMVYDKAKQAGIWAGEEVSFVDPLHRISGRYDLMIRLPSGELMGVDVKSMSPNKTVPVITAGRQGYEHLEPRWKDLPQIMSYLQWYRRYGVRFWSLYYITRDAATQEYVFAWNIPDNVKEVPDEAFLKCWSKERAFEIPWLTWGQVKARYSALAKAVSTKTVPPRDFCLTYSNSRLLEMAKAGGGGNQLVPLSMTDAKTVENRHRVETKRRGPNVDEHPSYLDKGDFNCAYCAWKTLCHFGMSPHGTPSMPVVSSRQEFEDRKRPAVATTEVPDIEI